MLTQKEIPLAGDSLCRYATLYEDSSVKPRAVLYYFHGGGLLYGTRSDLPALHLNTFASQGFQILAFDYPLAPGAKLPLILTDAAESVNSYHSQNSRLPYFLWGRSAGAYLCLLLAAKNLLKTPPAGILSWYGYGFLTDNWFCSPSPWYLSLPRISLGGLSEIPVRTSADLNTAYSLYVYARQSGKWKDLLYEGREKYFYLDYSLRSSDTILCPLFCAHSTGDPDVPFAEFTELASRYKAQRFIAPGNVHDFDRDEDSPVTGKLLSESVSFLAGCLS